jgi:hypothetical protein
MLWRVHGFLGEAHLDDEVRFQAFCAQGFVLPCKRGENQEPQRYGDP